MKIRTLTTTSAGLTGAFLVIAAGGVVDAATPAALCTTRGADGLPRLVLCSSTIRLPDLTAPAPFVPHVEGWDSESTTPDEDEVEDESCDVTLPDGRVATIDCGLGGVTIDRGLLERPALEVDLRTPSTRDESDGDSAPEFHLPRPTDLPQAPMSPQTPTIELPPVGGGGDP